MVECGMRESGSAVQQLCKGLFADPGFSFEGGYLQVWGDNFGPADKLARGGADGDETGTCSGAGKIESARPKVSRLQKVLS
jgi:hypothetical protein